MEKFEIDYGNKLTVGGVQAGINLAVPSIVKNYRAGHDHATTGRTLGFAHQECLFQYYVARMEAPVAQSRNSRCETQLSQVCHQCKTVGEKPLSKRWHDCVCGVHAQRDLYSAPLAIHVVGDSLDIRQAWENLNGCKTAAVPCDIKMQRNHDRQNEFCQLRAEPKAGMVRMAKRD